MIDRLFDIFSNFTGSFSLLFGALLFHTAKAKDTVILCLTACVIIFIIELVILLKTNKIRKRKEKRNGSQ